MAQTTSSSYSFFDTSPLYHPSVKDGPHGTLGSVVDEEEGRQSPIGTAENHPSSLENSIVEHTRDAEYRDRNSQDYSTAEYSQEYPQEHREDHRGHYQKPSHGSFGSGHGLEEGHETSREDKFPPLAPSPPPPIGSVEEKHPEQESTPVPTQNGLSAPPPPQQPQTTEDIEQKEFPSEFVEPKFITIPSPMVQQQVVQLQQRREQPELEVDAHASQHVQKQLESDMSPRSQTSHHSQAHYRDSAPSPAGSVSSLLQSSSPEIFMHQNRQPRASFSSTHTQTIQREPPRDLNVFAPSSLESAYSVGQPRPEFANFRQQNQSHDGGVSLDHREEQQSNGPWGSARIGGSTGMRHSSFGSSTSPVSARGGESLMATLANSKEPGVIARPTPPSTTGSAVKEGQGAYTPPSAVPPKHVQQEQARQGISHHHHHMHSESQGKEQPTFTPQVFQNRQLPPQQQQQQIPHGGPSSKPSSHHSSGSSILSPSAQLSSYPFSPQAVGAQSSATSSVVPPVGHRFLGNLKAEAPSPAGSGVSNLSTPPVLPNVPPPAPSAPPPTERYQMPPGVAQAFNKEIAREEYPPPTHFSPTKSGNVMSAGSSSLNPNRLSGGYPKGPPHGAPPKNSPKLTTGIGGVQLGSANGPKGFPGIGAHLNGGSFIVGGVKIPASSIELPRPPSIFEEDPIPAEYRPNKRIQSADQDSIEGRLGRVPEKPGSGQSNYSAGQPTHIGGGRILGDSPVRQGLGINAQSGSSNFTSPPMPSLGSASHAGSTKEAVMRGQWGSTGATSIPAVRHRNSGGESSYLKNQVFDDHSYQRQDETRDHPRARDQPQSGLGSSASGLSEARNYIGEYQSPPIGHGQRENRLSQSSYDGQSGPRPGQFLQHLHSQANAAAERNQQYVQQQGHNWPSSNSAGSGGSFQGRLGHQQQTPQQSSGHQSNQLPRHVLTSPPANPMSPDVYQHTNPSVGPTPELPILSHPSLRRTESMEQKDSEDDYFDSLSSLYPTLPTDHLRSLHKFALFLQDDAMAGDSAEKLREFIQASTSNRNSQNYSNYEENEKIAHAHDDLRKIADARMKKWNDWVDQEEAERKKQAGPHSSGSKPPIGDIAKNGSLTGTTFNDHDDTPTEEDNVRKDGPESPAMSKKSEVIAPKSLLDEDEEKRPPSPPENLLSPSPTPTYIQVAKAPKVDLVLQMPRPIVTVPTMKLDPSSRRQDDEMSTVAESELGDSADYGSYSQYAVPTNGNYRPIDPKNLVTLLSGFNRGNTNRNGGLVSGPTSPSQDIPPLLHAAYAALETATNNPSLENYLNDARRNLEQKTLNLLRDAESEAVSRRQLHQQQANMLYSTRRYTAEELQNANIDFEKGEAKIKLEMEKKAYLLFENEYVEVCYKDVKRQLEILGGRWYEDVRVWLLEAAASTKTTTALDYHLILECIDLLNKFFTTMEQHEHVLQNLVSERNGRYLQVSIAPLLQFGDTLRAQDAERRFWADEQERQLIAKKDALKRAKEHSNTIELVVTDVIRGLKRKYEEVVDGINNVIFQFPQPVIPDLFRRFFDYDKNRNHPPPHHSDADFIVPKPVIELLRDGTGNLSDLLGLMKLAMGFQNEPQIKVCEAKCSLQVAEDHAQTAGVTSPSQTSAACSAGLGKVLPPEIKRLREEQTQKLALIQEDLIDILRRLNAMVSAFEKDPRLPSSLASSQHYAPQPQPQPQHQHHHSQSWQGSSDMGASSHQSGNGMYNDNRWSGQMTGLGHQISHNQHSLLQQAQQSGLGHHQSQMHSQHVQQQHHGQLGGLPGGLHNLIQQQSHIAGSGLSNTYLQQQSQQRGPSMQSQQQAVPALRTMLGNLRAGGHNYGIPSGGSAGGGGGGSGGYGGYSNSQGIWHGSGGGQ
ncbi:hypothetical protein ABW19_dt0204779 [Dactylella cylindrospora]|nr:hypothetical protein ABW19_dt0204779 [Dactylella cylindrospora]